MHHVKDLTPEQRHAAEILLGHAISEDETVSIKSIGPSTIIASKLSPEERITALADLKKRLAGPECKAAEEEAAVNEALRSTRPNYRPVG